MQVYNGRITNAFREIQLAGYKIKKLEDGKYQVEHVWKDFDNRVFIFETFDELQAFGEGISAGELIEFEAEVLMKKDTFVKHSKDVLDKLRQALNLLEKIVDKDFLEYFRNDK